MKARVFVSLLLTFCFLAVPATALAKKGEKNFKRGLQYEKAQQWEKAAQEFTLAVAANPSNVEYQLHFRRASFNASQAYMQQGRALAEQRDYIGAYNAFRQAYGYDPVNGLAVSEMERMLRLQSVKDGTAPPGGGNGADNNDYLDNDLEPGAGAPQDSLPAPRVEQLRVINFSGDLKSFIRSLAEQLSLNVVFDRQSFSQSRSIDINLREVTTAQALDYVFLQENLFFQKLSRRTILVADQTRRPQYQQLVLRTFFLSNTDPNKARTLVQQAIPPSVGRPQTIVVPDLDTNSLTVRDTAENVRLIGELLRSVDKDRAEVVMDVNIYEVSRTDLMQFGNQLGTDTTLTNLGGLQRGFSILQGATGTVGMPTALGTALVFPSSSLAALQSRNRTKLIASTQVHAFNGEESQARIGQRVPVQTAQAYPFGVQTGQPQQGTGNIFPSGGFPVINYEPTGLTLKFTPQVFPNLDVQVKMSIESKDVLGAGTLTPTFTERTITGTARVQNNRTMMLASVAQDIESSGRKGLPLLGLIPVFGRLFTAPTRDDRQVDIVIAVTPRVLRAPAVTPRDEEMRPSGTLQSPTTGSLEAMIREADREEQLAAARRLPRNVVVQIPDVEPAPFDKGAPATQARPNRLTELSAAAAATARQEAPAQNVSTNTPSQTATTKSNAVVDELPEFVPAPKPLVSDKSAAEVAALNTGSARTQNAALTSLPSPIETAVSATPGSRVATISLTPGVEILNIGETRRFAIELKSDVPLELAVLALRFDPRIVRVKNISAGNLFGDNNGAFKTPGFTQSIDPSGLCLISISTMNGAGPLRGMGTLVFIDVEGLAGGNAGLSFAKESMHVVAIDARDVVLELTQGRAAVQE